MQRTSLRLDRFTSYFLLAILAVLCWFVFAPGLAGTYVLDDWHTIAHNERIAISNLQLSTLNEAIFSSTSGPLRRPLAMLSFAINYYLTGFNPFYFKLTNLLIHIMNGIGIFFLTSLILRIYRIRIKPEVSSSHAQWICIAVTAAWMLHPFNLSGVLYVVQRMTSLSALFSIWALSLFTWGRIQIYHDKNGIAAILASIFILTPLACLCKENGVLLPFLMFAIEIIFFNFQTQTQAARRFLASLYFVIVAIPIIAVVGYTLANPNWVTDRYQTRDFTLTERLMTQARVLWFYVSQITLPNPSEMGLYHDDIAISRSLTDPTSTLWSVMGVLLLIGVAFISRRKAPLIAFGLAFFLIGHALESTIFPLEIAYEHRNYLPMYGILLFIFYYLLNPLIQTNLLRLRQFVAIALIALFAFNTHVRAKQWANPFDFAQGEVDRHPNSLRANAAIASTYSSLSSTNPKDLDRFYLIARHYYEQMTKIDPHDPHGLIGLIMLNTSRGKKPENEWIVTLSGRLERAPHVPIIVGNKLELLSKCTWEKICQISANDLEKLFQSTLNNPNVTGGRRAAVFSAAGFFHANLKHDHATALTMMRQAVELAPQEIRYRLTLADFLLALSRHTEAKEQLNIAENLDVLRTHTIEITRQRKRIEK